MSTPPAAEVDPRLGWPTAPLFLVPIVCALHFIPPELQPTLDEWTDLHGEATIGSWFTGLWLAAVAALAVALAWVEGDRPRLRRGWILVALLYAFKSLDESIAIHEASGRRMQASWVLLYAPLSLLAVVLVVGHCRAVGTPWSRRLLFGLLLQITGALGLEALQVFVTLPPAAVTAAYVLEEALEMTGVIVVAHACWFGLRGRLRIERLPAGPPGRPG